MGTIYWSEFSWEALAGILAVFSATWVACNQLKLKRQELRLQLLDRRRECIDRFRKLSGKYNALLKLDDDDWIELRALGWEVELIFPDTISVKIERALKDIGVQNIHRDSVKELKEYGDHEAASVARHAANKSKFDINDTLWLILNELKSATKLDRSL